MVLKCQYISDLCARLQNGKPSTGRRPVGLVPRPAARLTPPRPRRGAAYQLLEHNCNHFTDEVAQFLCGARVPKHIVRQPDTDLPPALRAALTELLAGAGQVPRGADPPYL